MNDTLSPDMISRFRDLKLLESGEGPRPQSQQEANGRRLGAGQSAATKSQFIPAICNFQTARKMAQENLEHQPLPDAVIDIAFRKAQAAGFPNPGIELSVGPYATGEWGVVVDRSVAEECLLCLPNYTAGVPAPGPDSHCRCRM